VIEFGEAVVVLWLGRGQQVAGLARLVGCKDLGWHPVVVKVSLQAFEWILGYYLFVDFVCRVNAEL